MSYLTVDPNSDEFRIACFIAANQQIKLGRIDNARPKRECILNIRITLETILIHDHKNRLFTLFDGGVPFLVLTETEMNRALTTYSYLLRTLIIVTSKTSNLIKRSVLNNMQIINSNTTEFRNTDSNIWQMVDFGTEDCRYACFISANDWIDINQMNLVRDPLRTHKIAVNPTVKLLKNKLNGVYKLMQDGDVILELTGAQMILARKNYGFILGMIEITVSSYSDLKKTAYINYLKPKVKGQTVSPNSPKQYTTKNLLPKSNNSQKYTMAVVLIAAFIFLLLAIININLVVLLLVIGIAIALVVSSSYNNTNSRHSSNFLSTKVAEKSPMGQQSGTVIIYTSNGKVSCSYSNGCVPGYFNLSELYSVEIVSEAEAKSFARKVGWGTAAYVALGTVFSGGMAVLGAGAALLATGNSKLITYLITLNNGKQYILTSADKIYIEIRCSLLN